MIGVAVAVDDVAVVVVPADDPVVTGEMVRVAVSMVTLWGRVAPTGAVDPETSASVL
jgi:hypothetical protein